MPAGELRVLTEAVQSGAGLKRLQELRQSGGTLGQVTEAEHVLLQRAAGMLGKVGQREYAYVGFLNDYRRLVDRGELIEKAALIHDIKRGQYGAGSEQKALLASLQEEMSSAGYRIPEESELLSTEIWTMGDEDFNALMQAPPEDENPQTFTLSDGTVLRVRVQK
jgi:hypothetical protein